MNGSSPDPHDGRRDGGGHRFDRGYWEGHWQDPPAGPKRGAAPANPYLVKCAGLLKVTTVLDAGCGAGGESIWLASQVWQVTAADISSQALSLAKERAGAAGVGDKITWVETDLSTWRPGQSWGLVTTNYAHPSIPHLDFYRRIGEWVQVGGTFLIVGHRGNHGGVGEHQPPTEATVSAEQIAAALTGPRWRVDAAEEHDRTANTGHGQVTLRDVVVRATRLT